MTSLLLGIVLAASPARPPAFELHALGVLGGDTDGNLSCFLLGAPGEPPVLMIDGGSVAPGLRRWLEKRGVLASNASPTVQAKAMREALRPVRALLLTHAHLDHWGGFVDMTTLDFELAAEGKPSMQVVGLPQALEALRDEVFHGPLWADFTKLPAKNPALVLQPLAPGQRLELAPFQVEDVLLHHAVPSAAFLVRRGAQAYLHLGDTGATQAVWELARPLLRAHQLHAISLEMSYGPGDEKLAALTGHLARNSFLLELAKLAEVPPPAGVAMSQSEALALATRLAPFFRDCPVIVIHVKALSYDAVKREVAALKAAGLNVILPEQGGSYRL